jgi:hypothetical protein
MVASIDCNEENMLRVARLFVYSLNKEIADRCEKAGEAVNIRTAPLEALKGMLGEDSLEFFRPEDLRFLEMMPGRMSYDDYSHLLIVYAIAIINRYDVRLFVLEDGCLHCK